MEYMRNDRQDDIDADLSRLLNGSPDDYAIFVERTQRLVWHVVGRMVRDPEDRKDLCQDVFLKIFRARAGFRGESRVSTWVARIAYNASLNHIRKRKPFHIALENGRLRTAEPQSEDPGPDRLAEEKDEMERLKIELERLPARYRVALTLFHVDGLDIRSIAEVMGMHENTIKSHLHRARRRLRERVMESAPMEEACVPGI
jgi:RNA polymerase sigma factor (sigma-70 family)